MTRKKKNPTRGLLYSGTPQPGFPTSLLIAATCIERVVNHPRFSATPVSRWQQEALGRELLTEATASFRSIRVPGLRFGFSISAGWFQLGLFFSTKRTPMAPSGSEMVLYDSEITTR